MKVKAISIREPYASYFRDGTKTIETRTWTTDYRGKLLLCCSKNPPSAISGKAFAIADLADIKPMTREDEKSARCQLYPNANSWFLENVKLINLFPVEGQLGLFEVDYNGKQ